MSTIKGRGYVLRLDDSALRRLQEQGGDVDTAVQRAAGRARDYARQNITQAGRVDTGRLRNSIRYERRARAGRVSNYLVGSDLDYAIYQEEGTRGPIVPRRAKVLRFRAKGGGGFVFAQQVRGVQPAHFMRNALRKLSVRDFGL